VIRQLSQVAQKTHRIHGVILMVELGDRREGIMPEDLIKTVRQTLRLPNIVLKGIGTNLACRCGIAPDDRNMSELSALAEFIEATFDIKLEIVSGGNSANLEWDLSDVKTGRINNLRLGEAILLGCETLHRQPLDGLFTDAFTLVAEVIESKVKPSQPSGTIAQTAFGEASPVIDRGLVTQSILALGRQDTDPNGLLPPAGIEIMGASSDHLILVSDSHALSVGSEVSFQLNYSALVLAMTSPFVTRVMKNPALLR
ncbi:MAG: alanine racemase, partial [Pelovirga sp.]